MIFGIGHEKRIAAKGQALRLIELGRCEITVLPPGGAGTDHLQQRAVQFGDDNAVVIAVGNEQPARGLVGNDFARETQRRGDGRVEFHVKAQGRFVQQLLLSIMGHRRAGSPDRPART